jgi:hypothetical protein
MLNVTFNNISVISWRSVILVQETGGRGENHQPVEVTDKLYRIMFVHLTLMEIRTHNNDNNKKERQSLNCYLNIMQSYLQPSLLPINRGRRGRDRMVVGLTTTYAIGDVYHH